MKPEHIIAPPGTRMPQRQNVGLAERVFSLVAGGALGVAASRQKGVAGAALSFAGLALLARGATGAAPLRRYAGEGPDERAFAKKAGWRTAAVASRSVTIGASRREVYDRFRNFAGLPAFMVNVISVRENHGTLDWVTEDPSGRVEWQTVITQDVPGEVLAWDSVKGTPVPTKTIIGFRDAPGGRGTEVHATVAYRPPGGTAGKLAAKLTQKEPGIQLRRDLKRLKMFIETGETATNAPQGTAPKA